MSWKLQSGSVYRTIGLLAVLVCSLLAFQNCSQPYEGDGLSANSKLAKKMDFAYDATIDQIAYMSCPALKDNADPDAFFSIRAGAYRSGGLKLKDEFFETYSKKLPERLIDLLHDSPANSGTVLQLAIRQVGALNNVVKNPGGPKAGIDYANLLATLGTYETNTHLVKTGLDLETGLITGVRTKYMRVTGFPRGARMEGSLNFGSSESIASSLRDGFFNTNKAILALTYTHASANGSPTDVRTPGLVFDDQPVEYDRAYGTGFKLTFTKPEGAKGWPKRDIKGDPIPGTEEIPYPTNILYSVEEYDLLNPGDKSKAGRWICPENLRFRIVRNGADLADANCKRGPDPELSKVSSSEALRIRLARNVLRVEDWYIDFNSRGPRDGGCIIPKKDLGTCYGDLNYVQYNYTSTTGCDPHSTKESNGVKSPVCLAWVSICYRDE